MLSAHESAQQAAYDSVARWWNLESYYWMYREKRERQVALALRLPGLLWFRSTWTLIAGEVGG